MLKNNGREFSLITKCPWRRSRVGSKGINTGFPLKVGGNEMKG